MMAVPSSVGTDQRSRLSCGTGDDGLHIAALKLLHSNSYTALRRLRCEVREGVVIIHGVVQSYYLKQLVQTIVQRVDGIQGVMNLVEVRVSDLVLAEDHQDVARAEP